MAKPFTTAARTVDTYRAILVTIEEAGVQGRGEARGIPLNGETPTQLMAAIEAVRDDIEGGISRSELQKLLPIGGARNAVDCALFDLEARLKGISPWELADVKPGPVTTVYTVSHDTLDAMVQDAKAHSLFTYLKIKISGPQDSERIAAIRAVRPHARLIIDANQSLSKETLPDFVRQLKALDVTMLEQPVPLGEDGFLEGFNSPIPLYADESINNRSALRDVTQRYAGINIKLDKTGGITEALALLNEARKANLGIMIGNMLGTSLAMAPAMLLARQADLVDLDGPLLLANDPEDLLTFDGPYISPNF